MRGALPKRAAGGIAARSIIMLVGLRPVLFVAGTMMIHRAKAVLL